MVDRNVQIKSLNGEIWDNIYPRSKSEIIETNEDRMFISLDDKERWDNKADISYVDNKVKTDVPVNAKFTDTVYTHPTTAGNKHIPTGGASDQFLKYSESGTVIWSPLPESAGASISASTTSPPTNRTNDLWFEII